ncbi:MAG: extracellular solute-binding protein [Treponema sp.]|nr:extracellular solute-binding protein [Treponema sp.]
MKRIIVTMFVLIVETCLVFAKGGTQAGTPSSGDGKIEFWNDKPNPEFYAGLAPKVKEVSGINVEIIGYPDTSSFQTAIQQSIRQPNSPGFFTWWSGTPLASLVKEGLVTDVSDLWENYLIPKGVSPSLADAFTFDGKIYAALWNVNYNIIVYNKAIFEKAGIAKTPVTFKEFLDACAKIKAIGIDPINGHNDSWGSFVWFENLVGSYDAELYTNLCNGTEKYTGDRMRAVMAIYKDMLDKGYFTAPNREWVRAFANGETAMANMHHGNNVVPMVRDYGLVPGKDFDAFVMPSMKSQKDVIFIEISPICVPAATASKDQALKVLEHWYDTYVAQYIFDTAGISLTSKISIQNTVTKKGLDFAADTENNQLLLRFYENTPAELRDVVITEMSRFTAGAGSIDQVLNTIQKKADEVFKK